LNPHAKIAKDAKPEADKVISPGAPAFGNLQIRTIVLAGVAALATFA
jgi:hypothetical protein